MIELPIGTSERPNEPGPGLRAAPARVEPGDGSATTAGPSGRHLEAGTQSETPVRVLVLDDEPSIRDFLTRALAKHGYEAVVASTGAAALEAIRRERPSAILCDHRMAGMTGTEFFAAAVEIEPELGRHFAFMSGDVLNPELHDFAVAREIVLLAKPFDLSTIESVVGALFADRT